MKPTPGPWRWADWSAPFGSLENEANMRTLEHNPKARTSNAVIRHRDDDVRSVLVLEDPDIDDDDKELIRAAPELREALAEMLSMFGGNMDRADYDRMKLLVEGP